MIPPTIDGPTLLCAVLRAGTIARLDLPQLETLDQAIAAQVRSLPAHLTPADALQDRALHTLRLCVAARLTEKRRERAQLQGLMDALYQAPSPDQAADQAEDPGATLTDQERACQLLAAALTLILQPPDNPPGGGGTRARLTPRPPTRPPGGIALQSPDETGQQGSWPQPRGRF